MENLVFCIKSNTVDTVQNSSCTNSSFWRGVYYSSSFGGGWEEAAILYQARGYEFPVIIPPLNDGDVYGYTVFKQDMTANTNVPFGKFVPNPTNNQTSLQYVLADKQTANLQVYDMNGRIVNHATLTGTGEYNLDTHNLSSGLYMYLVTVDGIVITRDKLVIVK
jgi:hypothetical protein